MADDKLQTNPTHLYSQMKQQHRIKVMGGLLPIQWQTKAGTITATSDSRIFNYQAPPRYMTDTVTFYDPTDQETIVFIDVLRPLSVTPKQRTMKPKQQSHFTIQGGSGDWSVINDANLNNVSKQKNQLIVTADEQAGQCIVWIQDQKTQEKISLLIKIYAPLDIK